jgi:hypothetical protein
MNLPAVSDNSQKKKLKPEHIGQVIVGAGLIYLLYKSVPYLLGALTGFWLLVALGVSLYVVFDGGIRRLVSTAFKVGVRSLTSLFVRTNPWAIIKVHIKNLKKSREEMDDQITNLNEVIGGNEVIIEKNIEDIKEQQAYGKKELSKGNQERAAVHANQVGRLDKYNQKLIKLTGKMRYLLGFLEKLHEKVGCKIEDMENDLSVQEREYKSLRASTNAFKKAMNIYKGNVDDIDMKNMAMEEIETQIGNFRGQIDKALRDSSKFMASCETMDEVNIERGLQMLNSIDENKYNDILQQLDAGPVKVAINNNNISQPSQNKYGSFLKS